jgi:hypothetical protein
MSEPFDKPLWAKDLDASDFGFRVAVGRLARADEQRRGDVLSLVALWNKRMGGAAGVGPGGRNKVRVLTADRFRKVRQLLDAFSADEIAAAIELYAGADWQRKNRAWMTFDHFATASRIVTWVERSMAEREAAVAVDPRVAGLQAQIAAKQREMAESDRLKARYEALDEAEKRGLGERAFAELVKLGRRPRNITPGACRMQSLVILRREGLEQPETGGEL